MPQPRPTPAELAILRVLWDRSRATVREVHEVMSATESVGYTTVLKQLQIMHRKGLVERDTSLRSHVYAPTEARETTQRSLVSDLLDRAFGGSAVGLVLQALQAGTVSDDELAAIRALLDEQERSS